MKIKIFASVLDSPNGDTQGAVDKLDGLVDGIHYDVMDGVFVPPTTYTAEDLAKLNIPMYKSVHLMVEKPDLSWIEDFAKAGADMITIHVESQQESLVNSINLIKEFGCAAGVSLKPMTKVEDVDKEVWSLIDEVLIMSVEPGWGGQKFMPEVLDKVKWIRDNYPDLDIAIDGGINAETGKLAVDAGCNVLGVGSYIVKSADYTAAVASLKQLEN